MQESLKLIEDDGTIHTVSFQALKRSEFISKYLLHTDPNATEIIIAETNRATLCEVIEYLDNYKDSEPRPIVAKVEEDDNLTNGILIL